MPLHSDISADSARVAPAAQRHESPATVQSQGADSSWSPVSEGHLPEPFHSLADTLFTRGIVAPDSVAARPAAAVVPDWHMGLPPEPRPMQPGNRSGFLILVAIMFVVMTFNFRHFSRVLRQYYKEALQLRRGRENVFDEHPEADARVLVLMIVQCVLCSGILLCAGICRLDLHMPALLTGRAVGLVIAACALFYLVQLAAYATVGFTFASKSGRREWLRGFNATQALLGITLVPAAVLAVFYPPLTFIAVAVGAGLYLLARLLFIIKGIRIFYDNFSSLLYFILYLCTLEIIPVIFIYECSRYLVSFAG